MSRNIDARRARRRGRDQRGARLSAGQSAEQSDLSQSESGRCADHDHRADLGQAIAARSCTTRPRPSCSSSSRRSTGVGQVIVGGSSRAGGAHRCQSDAAQQLRPEPGRRAHVDRARRTPTRPRAACPTASRRWTYRRQRSADEGRRLSRHSSSAISNGAPVRSVRCRQRARIRCRPFARSGIVNGKPAASAHHLPPARRQHHRHRRRDQSRAAASLQASIPRHRTRRSRWTRPRRSAPRSRDVERTLMISIVLVILVVFVFLRESAHDARFPAWPCRCR